MSSLGRGLSSVIVVIALVLGTLWVLDNTQVGLNIKCRFLNDIGACLEAALTGPVVPPANPLPIGNNNGGAETEGLRRSPRIRPSRKRRPRPLRKPRSTRPVPR